MDTTARTHIIERLRRDLVGPYREDEVLNDRPSSIYLTGILWPGQARMGGEEDERTAVSGITGHDETDDADEGVSQNGVGKPSTAGVSFAVSASSGRPVIQVRVCFATYTKQQQSGEDGSVSETWQRHPYRTPEEIFNKPIFADTSNSRDLATEAGAPEGVSLNVRSIPYEHGYLVTVTLVNQSPVPTSRIKGLIDIIESGTLFQTSIEVFPAGDTRLVARPSGWLRRRTGDGSSRLPENEEDRSIALLYRGVSQYATGHNCSACWKEGEGNSATMVATDWIPQARVRSVSAEGSEYFNELREGPLHPLDADWLVQASDWDRLQGLAMLPDAYCRWLDDQEAGIVDLNESEQMQAQQNLKQCRSVASRIRDGITSIESSPAVSEAFKLANRAMLIQRRWGERNSEARFRWRPFQLGFILMTLSSVADRKHSDRAIMDLLWFPTGGGKTEAYLALIAFLVFYRRLSSPGCPDAGAGVAAIMRYTLRLLTTQQFERAASMILACETIRREMASLGTVPFSIGLWVGGGATPNKTRDSEAFLNGVPGATASPEQLLECPSCHEKLKWDLLKERDRDGVLRKVTQPWCDTVGCVLNRSGGPLPVFTVDEEIFAKKPSLVIATIDKFAQIVRWPQISDFFAISPRGETPLHPPDLIIQDELHLISGPLGTVAGLYEVAIDHLFTRNGQRPKIIGSTATIRRAGDQVRALFDRKTCQFPPPAIDAGDSGFSVEDQEAPGRLYIGVTTAGRSAKFSLGAVAASLLQSSSSIEDRIARDHYWTLIAYFNSLRELGGAVVLMQDDVRNNITILSRLHGELAREVEVQGIEELTSRRTQEEVRDMLKKMGVGVDHPEDRALDAVLATNMLSVGVDIPRLGLMLVNGQPKSVSEYIQATSRVGRGKVPGLIVSVLNNAKARDRSHYETFATWHATLYRDVEATGITPFAPRARDRALHGVFVALVRHLVPGMLFDPPHLESASSGDLRSLINYVTERARSVDPEETDVESELEEYCEEWEARRPTYYWKDKPKDGTSLLQSAERAASLRELDQDPGEAWSAMNNMRSVETSTQFKLVERRYRPRRR